MCSNYIPARAATLTQHFGVSPPAQDTRTEAFPGYLAPIIRRASDKETTNGVESAAALFGMVPAWADMKLARSTYNARSETVAIKPSFRHAWKKGQFCIVPAESIFEPSYESGRAVRWNIAHAEGRPLGVAGIWEWRSNGIDGQPLLSFSMLTINADDHPLMQRIHKPTDEKCMLVFLEPDEYENWLHADTEEARSFLTQHPAERLTAQPAPKVAGMQGKATSGKTPTSSLF